MIYCLSPSKLVRNSTLIIRQRTGTPYLRIMWHGYPDNTNKVEKLPQIYFQGEMSHKYNQSNNQINPFDTSVKT